VVACSAQALGAGGSLALVNVSLHPILFYLLVAAGQAVIPTYWHFTYRTPASTYFSAAFNAVTPYYEYAWWTLWISELAIGGVTFITTFISLFQVMGEVNMLIWYIFQGALGLLAFFTTIGFYTYAYMEADTAANTVMMALLKEEVTLYIAAVAFTIASLNTFWDSFVAGNMLSIDWDSEFEA